MRRSLLLSFLILLTLSVVAVSCGGSSATTSSSTTASTSGGAASSTQSSGAGGAQVAIKGFAFGPASVTIKAGESVTWTNQDSTGHTVAGDQGEFTSPNLANGATFSFTFAKAGTYTYHCSIHPTMKGTVVVQ